MRFFKAALRCALVLPLSSLACGGTEGEPGVPDAAARTDTGAVSRPKVDAAAADARSDTAHADAGKDTAVATDADARAATDADGKPDADASPPRDHGEASTTYPAFTPFVPQIQYGDGPVLTNAQIVTITWAGDPTADTFEAFGDDVGSSDYWHQTTSEYKVGQAFSGPQNHIRLAASETPVASWADTDVAAWVTDHVTNNGMYGWPAPTSNTVYLLYASPATDVLYNGSSACGQGIGGYHSSVVIDGADVAYAIVLQCQGGDPSLVTAFASHELIEAATDPHPQDITGYVTFDSDHLAWDVFQNFQDEVGDACEYYFDAFFDGTFSIVETLDAGADGGDAGILFDAGPTSFAVQRTWSNVNAAAGHAPCRPTDYAVYYNVAPLQLDPTVTINLSSQGGPSNLQGQGYRIASGATRTFPVGFVSDGPTSGPWSISAQEGNPLTQFGQMSNPHLTISIDQPQGQNGDIAYVTVTVNSVDTTMNGELITIISSLSGAHRTFMPILISNE